MTMNFFFCDKDVLARFSDEAEQECPLCLEPMAKSGWMQTAPEKGLEGAVEALPA